VFLLLSVNVCLSHCVCVSVSLCVSQGGLVKGLGEAKSKLKSFGGFAKNVTKGLFAFTAASIGLIAKIGQMGGKLAQTQISMEAFLGSAEKAEQLIKDLRQFADVTPFDTNSILEAGKVLTSVEKDITKIIPLIKMLGDISAGSGKDLNEIVKIFVKIKNQGRVTFEELNQLTNANIISMDQLGKSLGIKGKAQLRKFIEAGKVGFKDINKLLKEVTATGAKFGGLMEKQSRTLLGRFSTLQGKIQNLATDLGGPLQDSLISITDTFIDWTSQAKNLRGPLGLLIKDLGSIADLLELTRDDTTLESSTGLKDFGTADLIADVLASGSTKLGGFEVNPLAAVGRIGQSFGLGSDAIGAEMLGKINEGIERV